VLTTSPTESEAQLSFVALRDLIGDAFDRVADTLPPPQRRALAVALLLEDPGPVPPDAGAVAAGFLGTLRSLAAAEPVALAVDDIQWLDDASATALAFAARRLRDEPVSLLLAQRSSLEGERRQGELERAVLGETVVRIAIGPLSVGALHLLVRSRLEAVFPLPVMRRIHETSGGNPFYALELARALVRHEGTVAPGEPLPVPTTLRDLIRDRLAHLSADTGETLLAAAALAGPTVDLVTAACGERARAHLEEAAAANVLEIADGSVRFTHPLIASVAYSAAPAAERSGLHARLAALVEEPEERGRHVALSVTAPSEEAARVLDDAAHQARARGAPGPAADLADQALRLTPPDEPDRLASRTLDAAGLRFESGDPDGARALLESALENEQAGPARAELLTQLARVYGFGIDVRRAATLFRDALTAMSPESPMRVDALRGLAVAQMRRLVDLREAARLAESAAVAAERTGNHHQLAEALSVHALIEALLGREEATRLIERADRLDEPSVEAAAPSEYFMRGLWGPRFHGGVLGVWHDDLEGAVMALRTARDHAVELGDESALPLILRWLATAELLLGRWAPAVELTREAEELAVQTGQRSQQAVVTALRAHVLAHQGRATEARETALEGLRLSDASGSMFGTLHARSALGLLEMSLEDYEAAHEQLAPLVEHVEAAGVREPGATRFFPDEIEALVSLGRLDEAEAILDRLERRATRLRRVSALAAAGRCRGLLEAARGRTPDGIAACEGALVQHDLLPMPFERARTMLTLGTFSGARSGRPPPARPSKPRSSRSRSSVPSSGRGVPTPSSRESVGAGRPTG
jgi:tetratricopeptide (TPR) repeat protein